MPNKSLRILVLEDVASDVILINHELRRGGFSFESKRVETRDEFLKEIRETPPDLILSDHGLPSFDGFTALAIARNKCPDTPFIFVTGSMGEEMAIESLKSGATDYVLKERLSNLVPAIQRALRLAEERAKRRHTEAELRESEERFRMLIGGVRDHAIFMLDPNGRVSSWNPGAELIMEYPAAEAIGLHIGRFYRPQDLELRKPEQDLHLASVQGHFEEEGWRVRASGQDFWANVILTALRDQSHRARGFVMITRDITERKQAEESLRKSEERYRRLVELCPDALFVLDEGGVIFANQSASELLGIHPVEQLIGTPISEFLHPECRENFEHRLAEAAQSHDTGTPRSKARLPSLPATGTFAEETFLRTDGSPVEAEVALSALIFQDRPALLLIARDITERKRADAALRESESRKSAILETSLDAILCIDQEGMVREWNAAAERIFGYPRAAALGRRLDELIIPPALRDRYLHGLADYLMTGVGSLIGRPIELFARNSAGTEFPVELAITRIQSLDPAMFTVLLRDITDRKRTEDALRQSEARKAAVVETALDAIVSIDHEGRIVEWNPTAEKMFGYSRALALGQDMARLIIPPSQIESHQRGFSRYLRTGRGRLIGRRTELTAVRANRGEFPVEVTITRVPGEGPPTFTGYLRDITERKRAEEALRKSEERFRMLVEGAEDYAIYMLDPGGRVRSWNAGAERITGYRASEITGRRLKRLFTPDDVQRGKPEQILGVASTDGRFRDEGWRVRKDGSRFWANEVVTALRDPQGNLYGLSIISRDMSARKQAEDQIRKLNAELEQRVQERTTELRSAYEEMEAFSYSISHDLRAPVIAIAGFVEILRREIENHVDEESRRYLETISDSTRQMGSMIDALLDFSRMSRAEMSLTRVNLAEMIGGILRDLQPQLKGRRIEWTLADLPSVHADPSLLRQVVSNLISNAVKYSRTRDPARIEIGSSVTDREVICYVRDNGVGFDPQYAGKLFNVFQRLHGASEFEGTGIGLANVRRIIQRHGGRTWGEGEVDAGATFYFSLPIQTEAPHVGSKISPPRRG